MNPSHLIWQMAKYKYYRVLKYYRNNECVYNVWLPTLVCFWFMSLCIRMNHFKNLTLLPNTPESIPLSNNAFCFVLWLIVFYFSSPNNIRYTILSILIGFSIHTQPYNNRYLRTLLTIMKTHNSMSLSSVYSTICTVASSVKLNLFQSQTQVALVIRCLFVTCVETFPAICCDV